MFQYASLSSPQVSAWKGHVGTMFCCQALGKIMADQGHGKIINIASIAGTASRCELFYRRIVSIDVAIWPYRPVMGSPAKARYCLHR